MATKTITTTPGHTIDVPDPRHTPKATRRTFTAGYKAEIVREYEQADRKGRGEILRREGLYNSLVTKWRQQAADAATRALATSPGRPRIDPLVKENQRLQNELDNANDKLATAEKVIEVQGKLSALLDHLAADRATPPSER